MTGTTSAPASTTPVDVEDLRDRVAAALTSFLAGKSTQLRSVDPACGDLVDAVTDLTAGGKRLRPAFCYWGWRGAGGTAQDEGIVAAAAALELFQAAALIHDDLMDDSDTRRGMPAVHRRFAARHADRAWSGDADRFGLAGAVLAGDMCLVWTDELFSACGLPPERLAAGRRVVDRMRTELLGGQYLDVVGQSDPATDPEVALERARHVIRYKSAKYTIEHPLLLGGTLAGADEALLRAYTGYGLALGEAFQLRDDVLGVFGDPARTGKPAGDDLREGKRTVLVALALGKADAAQADLVDRLLGDRDLDDDGVAALRTVLTDTGAAAEVETMIAGLAEEATTALADADLGDEARGVLQSLVATATERAR
jgi:geranylgeranyl diphosphate synthase type I